MKRTHFAFLLLFPLAAACGTVGYAVPGELSAVAAAPVHGRQGWMVNQRLSFGGYQTGEVRRSWTRGTEGHDVLATDHGEYSQRYEFALHRDEAKVADVACTAEGSGAQTLNVTWRSKRTLDCDLAMAGGEVRTLRLDSSRDQPLAGRVMGDPAFSVAGSDRVRVGGRIDGTAGYTIARDNGTPAAAVDVVGNGAVFMQGGGDDAVAAIAAALLLYQDPLEASERFRR